MRTKIIEKICCYIPNLFTHIRGGYLTPALQARELNDFSFFYVLTQPNEIMDKVNAPNITYLILPLSNIKFFHKKFLRKPKNIYHFLKHSFALRKLLKKNQIKIVHIHNLQGYYPAKVATLFMKVKIILHVRMDYDFTSPRWRFALNHVSHTVAVSESLYHKIQRENHKPLKNLSLIENGALDNYTDKPFTVNTNRPLKFLMIGDIEPLKGQYEFIKDIYSRLTFESELNLAGYIKDENLVNGIIKIKEDFNLNISLLGFVHDIKSEIEKADCIISYAKSEGLARNLIESMALAKPVVASDVIGNTDVIDQGVNGYKIKKDDYLSSFFGFIKFL